VLKLISFLLEPEPFNSAGSSQWPYEPIPLSAGSAAESSGDELSWLEFITPLSSEEAVSEELSVTVGSVKFPVRFCCIGAVPLVIWVVVV
jgi:hypothetical protein